MQVVYIRLHVSGILLFYIRNQIQYLLWKGVTTCVYSFYNTLIWVSLCNYMGAYITAGNNDIRVPYAVAAVNEQYTSFVWHVHR